MGGMNLRAIKTFEERMDLQQLANDLDKRRQQLMQQQQQQQWPKVLALEEDASVNLLQSLVYTDDKWLRIRYSETTNSHPDFYAIGSMMELILGRTNILAKSDSFLVCFSFQNEALGDI
jgi:cell division protein ZapA (FtsZ GTPase activity inhibitor)